MFNFYTILRGNTVYTNNVQVRILDVFNYLRVVSSRYFSMRQTRFKHFYTMCTSSVSRTYSAVGNIFQRGKMNHSITKEAHTCELNKYIY